MTDTSGPRRRSLRVRKKHLKRFGWWALSKIFF